MHKTLIMLKPDAYTRFLVEAVRREVLFAGFKIVQEWKVSHTPASLLDLWPTIDALKWWYDSQEVHMGWDLDVWDLEGSNAVETVLEIKKYLRQKYHDERKPIRSAVFHCPDTYEDYLRERQLLLTLSGVAVG